MTPALSSPRKPLIQKLGIKPKTRIAILNRPRGYAALLGALPRGLHVANGLAKAPLDFIHFFARDVKELAREFPDLKAFLAPRGTLWVSWPKKSSRLAGDLDEKIIRRIGLRNRLVDVKVCAIDDTWSALKLVRPLRKKTTTVQRSRSRLKSPRRLRA